jgi:aminoglycoside phosphotransferase (APT) family kinase protein
VKRAVPAPLEAGLLQPYLARLEAGEDFKAVLEDLLLHVPLTVAEHMGLIMREGRGSWIPLLRSAGGSALFVGNGFSGTVHALAALGFTPHLYDVCEERMRFEAFRCEALTGVPCTWTVAHDSPALPFDSGAFQLVVQEAGAPAHPTGWRHGRAELARVSRGELVLTANNRLGYKRSLGRRGRFAVPSAWRFLKDLARPQGGEQTLAGYRRGLTLDGWSTPRAYALYPHSADFTHVVGLDQETPRLHVGPKERQNKLKLAAHTLGLFPVLAPSFAFVSARRELAGREQRVERILAQLAEITGEDQPVIDEWIASRGNCVVVQTRAASGDLECEEGRWCVHISLGPHKQAQVRRHHEVIEQLWARDQPVPVPQPLFFGELDGLTLSCERRLTGMNSTQHSGEEAYMRRLLEETAQHLERLVVRESRPVTERDFAELFDWRFDLVAAHAGREETRVKLEAMREATRERVLGHSMPLVLQHADLRSKHVQIDAEGRVVGFLDWGSSRDHDVPYYDLLQLIVHERKQATGVRIGDAWRALLTPGGLRTWERAALDDHARRLGLAPEVARAIEQAFPVFVAAMAESNWDYSRPRWVHHGFLI